MFLSEKNTKEGTKMFEVTLWSNGTQKTMGETFSTRKNAREYAFECLDSCKWWIDEAVIYEGDNYLESFYKVD